MSIAESVLDAVRAESARLGARVTAVGVRIGELSGIEPDSLQFCFDAIVQDSGLAPLALHLERVPRSNTCRACGSAFPVVDYNFTCTACGSTDTAPSGGDELTLAYVEVEDA
jgi:hydrogenase nickel incorporation protein HypA/HybF